jgi:hypothetical protein
MFILYLFQIILLSAFYYLSHHNGFAKSMRSKHAEGVTVTLPEDRYALTAIAEQFVCRAGCV